MTTDLFEDLLDAITELSRRVRDDAGSDPQRRAEGDRYLLRFLAAGITVCIEHDDTETPELTRSIENRVSWGLDNPDCNYCYTRVDGNGTYRIVGNRGTAKHVEFQVNTGHQGDGDFAGWRAVSSLSGDDLTTDADGDFEILLGGESTGQNWMALSPDAGFLLIRQYFDDWEHERPADLAIERLDVRLPPASLTADAMAARLDLLIGWLRVGGACWADLSAGLRAGEPGDIEPFTVPDEASGLKGQAYGMGGWRCRPDQAVVLEFEPPACRLWSLSLCDRFWQSIDFAGRQSSLNGSQSRLTDDRRFVGVISHDDPGVANWLDPGGETEGSIAVRYLLADSIPPLSVRTVARADLDAHVPTDVPRVNADERHETLRRRRIAVQRRYRR